ncbi:MAG: hypothetical protein CL581_10995 [Alteromonadaceae bacterium]|nr:hypothetical protein [Alteromonadaceae bacterium]MAA65289.1 hypothetical protein [Alteromonadaceae bacterium]
MYRIVGEHQENGNQRPMAHSADLSRLMARIRRDADLWRRLGWGDFVLEDRSLSVGYTPTLREHLRSMARLGAINYRTFRFFRSLCN